MANQPRHSAQHVIDAIGEAHGLVSLAARRLGCTPVTVRNYMARCPTVAAAVREAREMQKDVAEANLLKLINEGELGAIKYYLSTQAKDRGYVERQEMVHRGDPEAPIAIITLIPPAPRLTEGDADA